MAGTGRRARLGGLLALCATCAPHSARPHSITVVPMPRNAIDNQLPLWRDGSAPLSNGQAGTAATGPDASIGLCNETTEGLFRNSSAYCSGCFCSNGTSPCLAGQTCFWFSQVRSLPAARSYKPD
eukprot:SAG22_NODE_208_length_15237_cov_22.602774_3_plen_125_part_00